MPITTEFDWLTSIEPHDFAAFARGRIASERFRWLQLRWMERLLPRLTGAESEFLTVYQEWVALGCLGPSPTPPTSDFDYFPHGVAPREYIESALELLGRGEPVHALANLARAVALDFPARPRSGHSIDPSRSHKKKSKKGRKEEATAEHEAYERFHREREAHHERTLWQFAIEFRDVAGNPFRPVAFDPAWRTETVVGLAAGIDEAGAYERLPILADALEEAGCADPQVLSHARDPGVHVRGCWLVDMVLGRFA